MKKIRYGTPEYDQFCEALHYVNETLAKKMAGDGEGATALFEAKIVGAAVEGTGEGPGEVHCLLQPDKDGDRWT